MDVTKYQQSFEGIELEPTPAPHGSFWIGPPPRVGFTALCAAMLNAPIPLDDVTAGEAQIIQRRSDLLATLMGLQQATSNTAIRRCVIVRRANVLSRN